MNQRPYLLTPDKVLLMLLFYPRLFKDIVKLLVELKELSLTREVGPLVAELFYTCCYTTGVVKTIHLASLNSSSMSDVIVEWTNCK